MGNFDPTYLVEEITVRYCTAIHISFRILRLI